MYSPRHTLSLSLSSTLILSSLDVYMVHLSSPSRLGSVSPSSWGLLYLKLHLAFMPCQHPGISGPPSPVQPSLFPIALSTCSHTCSLSHFRPDSLTHTSAGRYQGLCSALITWVVKLHPGVSESSSVPLKGVQISSTLFSEFNFCPLSLCTHF